jgi:hypothetical protein
VGTGRDRPGPRFPLIYKMPHFQVVLLEIRNSTNHRNGNIQDDQLDPVEVWRVCGPGQPEHRPLSNGNAKAQVLRDRSWPYTRASSKGAAAMQK